MNYLLQPPKQLGLQTFMIRPSLLTAIQTKIVSNLHYKRDNSVPHLPIASVFLWWAVSNILSYGF